MTATTSTNATGSAAVGARAERVVGRLEPGRAAFEAWFSDGGKWPAAVCRSGDGYSLASAQAAWVAWRAGRAHLLDTQQPSAFVFEWGAVSLPHGDPSRITCMSAHPTEAEALAQGNDCDFDWQVYPAYCVDDSKTPNVGANRAAEGGPVERPVRQHLVEN